MEPLTLVSTALISSVVGALVSSAFAYAKGIKGRLDARSEEDKATQQAMCQALRALLWRELQTIHTTSSDQGGLTVAQRRHLESVYSAYHTLGGNGTGTRLYQDSINAPVLDD